MLAAFGIEPRQFPDLDRWRLTVNRITNHLRGRHHDHAAIVKILTGMKDAHKSLIEALSHGGMPTAKVKVNLELDRV